MVHKIQTAIFPIAGLGTRFLPATKSIPKEMLIVGDTPVIEHAIREASESGIKKMILVTSPAKASINEYFSRSVLLEDLLRKKKKFKELDLIKRQTQLGEIIVTFQNEPKGLGHAVWCAKNLINDNAFAVILPDDIILSKTPVIKQLINLSQNYNCCTVLGVEKVDRKEVFKYGILSIKKKIRRKYFVESIVEKPDVKNAPSNLSVVGRYLLDSKIFNFLSKMKKGAGGEIQLTDGIQYLIKQSDVMGLEFEGKRFDCGNKLGFIKANLNYGLYDSEIGKELKQYLKKI